MAAYNKFQDFTEQQNLAVHNWGTHTFKIALTDTAPVATQTTWNTTDHPAPLAANGYPAGGIATTIGISEAAGTTTITGTQVIFTATPGGIGPFRYVILYNNSAASAAVAWWDNAASVTLSDTQTFTVKFNNASPGTIFTET